jgi:NAD(P)H-dependent FMN reductase
MKILTIVGSLRPDSTTGLALRVASRAAEAAGAEVVTIELGSLTLPFCDGRSDEMGYGGDVASFIGAVREADGLLIGSPNYHGSVAGALKNALDLLGPEAVRDKLVGLVATARGDAGAMNTLNHLRHICRWMNGWVIPAEVSIPRAQESFGPDGDVVADGLEEQLVNLGEELVRYAKLMGGRR